MFSFLSLCPHTNVVDFLESRGNAKSFFFVNVKLFPIPTNINFNFTKNSLVASLKLVVGWHVTNGNLLNP